MRASGYYWVRDPRDGEVLIARWNDHDIRWEVVGDDRTYDDAEYEALEMVAPRRS
jgi:hypothetical protein